MPERHLTYHMLASLATGHTQTFSPAQVALLQAEGHQLRPISANTYTLKHAALGGYPDAIAAVGAWPRGPLHVYQQTASTQVLAKKALAAKGIMRCGHVFLAAEQTQGRGRFQRPWLAPAHAALLLSIIAPPTPKQPGAIEALSASIGVAIYQCLQQFLPAERVAIKWPNDIWIDGRYKIAGILIEQSNGIPIIGIGLNTRLQSSDMPEELQAITTSLHQLGIEVDSLGVLIHLMKQLDYWLDIWQSGQWQSIHHIWHDACLQIGQELTVQHQGNTITGTVLDVNWERGLILRTTHGTLTHIPCHGTTRE